MRHAQPSAVRVPPANAAQSTNPRYSAPQVRTASKALVRAHAVEPIQALAQYPVPETHEQKTQSREPAPTQDSSFSQRAASAASSAFQKASDTGQGGAKALGTAGISSAKGALAALTKVGEAAVKACQVNRAAQGALEVEVARAEEFLIVKDRKAISLMREASSGDQARSKGATPEAPPCHPKD